MNAGEKFREFLTKEVFSASLLPYLLRAGSLSPFLQPKMKTNGHGRVALQQNGSWVDRL